MIGWSHCVIHGCTSMDVQLGEVDSPWLIAVVTLPCFQQELRQTNHRPVFIPPVQSKHHVSELKTKKVMEENKTERLLKVWFLINENDEDLFQ